MADKTTEGKALVDLTLRELQEEARRLGVRGWNMQDRAYLAKCIQAKRIANVRANAQAEADAAVSAAEEKAALAYEAAPEEGEAGEASAANAGAGATDAAQKLAAEHGLDLSTVEGTGKGGAVTAADVKKHLADAEG